MVDLILSRLSHVRGSGPGYVARCPAHEDRSPSLSLRDTGDRVLLHCHAGCSTEEILDAIGLDWSDLFREAESRGMTGTSHRQQLDARAVIRIARTVAYDVLYLQQPDRNEEEARGCVARLAAVKRRYGQTDYDRILDWVEIPRILIGGE
jgi:hypothetical protein